MLLSRKHLLTLRLDPLFLNAPRRGGGGFGDIPDMHEWIVNSALIEARVDLAVGRLMAAEWLQPMATRGDLRNAVR